MFATNMMHGGLKMKTVAVRLVIAMFMVGVITSVHAAPPQLYRQPAFEGPVRGDPDDLLLLAGDGLAADDTVVYRAVDDAGDAISAPKNLPESSDSTFGIATIVSAKSVPYSLTVKLPQAIRANQSYAIWVRTAGGEWSRPVRINDARPLWATPAYAYASAMPGFLPRELKVVGRNFRPAPGHVTLLKLMGPQSVSGPAVSNGQSTADLDDYVARIALPEHLIPGSYRIAVNRDGAGWVDIPDQEFDVVPDLPSKEEFAVSDARFGGCRPNDGADDTACIVRAVAAAARVGGTVYFGAGTWDLSGGHQPGVTGNEGLVVPEHVTLRGAGSALTRIDRHPDWNDGAAAAGFTLTGRNQVTGFTFHDVRIYRPKDRAGPFIQLGEDWRRFASTKPESTYPAIVEDVTISHNVFDKPEVAIGAGGIPIDRLFITYNIFAAYRESLELNGDIFDMFKPFRLDDSVIAHNIFKPSSELDVIGKTGTMASEIGASQRVDFSENTADGASSEYLYSQGDAKGWRAAFFWNPNNNVEEVLVSQNTATCTGDKIGDGEAFAFDNNTNTFAFANAAAVVDAGAASITVAEPIATRQNDRDVPIGQYYVGHWVQIVSGPGLGEVRKITGYLTDPITHRTSIAVTPGWDVVPRVGASRFIIGREYWQLYVLDNHVDNRQPLCQKSNRSRRAGGAIEIWGQSADSVIAGNRQYDSDGIAVQQLYTTAEHTCANCTMIGYFNYFLEIRDNLIDGEYDWNSDCSHSGITALVAAGPWEAGAPPTVGFGVSVSHNTIRHADGQDGGAISQAKSWYSGPAPYRWPLSETMLIHHNDISEIDGPGALPVCGSRHARIGIAFPDAAIAWHTVMYANQCHHVGVPVGTGGIDAVKVCPSSVLDSCECPSDAQH